jgi:hypothetical protein
MSEQLALIPESGALLRDDGMRRALEHADQKEESWSDRAMTHLKRYPGNRFRAEQVRNWSEQQGLPAPIEPRAWGGIFNRARREGLITRDGY